MRFFEFFRVYPDAIDNFHFWGALLFFILFLVYSLVRKMMMQDEYVSLLRRVHFKFFIPYLLSSFVYSLFVGKVNNYPLGSFIAGSFIYFSLLYVYLFSLLALVKKSISVNLLGQINDHSENEDCTQEKILYEYLREKRGGEYMRENGLSQMTKRGWMQEKGSSFRITEHGKRINEFTNNVLRLFNLVRY